MSNHYKLSKTWRIVDRVPNYILQHYQRIKSGKNKGKMEWREVGFYATPTGAINGYINHKGGRPVGTMDKGLAEAAREIRMTREWFLAAEIRRAKAEAREEAADKTRRALRSHCQRILKKAGASKEEVTRFLTAEREGRA